MAVEQLNRATAKARQAVIEGPVADHEEAVFLVVNLMRGIIRCSSFFTFSDYLKFVFQFVHLFMPTAFLGIGPLSHYVYYLGLPHNTFFWNGIGSILIVFNSQGLVPALSVEFALNFLIHLSNLCLGYIGVLEYIMF